MNSTRYEIMRVKKQLPVEPYGLVSSSTLSNGNPDQSRRRMAAPNICSNELEVLTDGYNPRATLKQPASYQFSADSSQHSAPKFPQQDLSMQPASRTNDTIEDETHQTHLLMTLLPCLYCYVILLRIVGQASMLPLQASISVALLLYTADLANVPRSTYLYGFLASMAGLAMTMIYVSAANGVGIGSLLLNAMITLLSLLATSLWILRHGISWLGSSSTTVSKQLEAALHGVLPPLFAVMTTVSLESFSNGASHRATLMPIVFAVSLAGSMLWIGCANGRAQLHRDSVDMNEHDNTLAFDTRGYCITSSMARGHTLLLLALPSSLQFVMQFGHRWTLKAWYDLLIVGGTSYLLQYFLMVLDHAKICRSPYVRAAARSISRYWIWFGRPTNLKNSVCPVAFVLVFCFAVQQRYLIALSQSFATHYLGTRPSASMTSLYWMVSTISLLLTTILRHTASTSGRTLAEEYQEDIMQLGLAIAGASLGKAFGLSWNFTPLPILAILGLALWLSTRLLRYLAVFLFVAQATGVVGFTYRFAGLEHMTMDLPLHGNIQLTIHRFAYCVLWTSSLFGIVTGLSLRSEGGLLGTFMRQWDVTGVLMFVYALTFSILEISLLKHPMPSNELAGVELDAEDIQHQEMLYNHSAAILSSAIMAGLAAILMRRKIITAYTGCATFSLGFGKALSFYIDANVDARDYSKLHGNGRLVFVRALITMGLIVVLILPRFFVQPIHVKTVSKRRSLSGRCVEFPRRNAIELGVYAFVVLPVTLVLATPYVLVPLMKALYEQVRDDDVYSSRLPVTELAGGGIALWALACLIMLNHTLPDGGGEAWRKITGLTFLFGMGVVFVAPTLGSGVDSVADPYAAMASVGSFSTTRGKYWTGGWGLLSTAIATLLALAGPLELKERASAGRKDRFLLFRTMVFSLLFGGGVACFIVLQSMRESNIISLLIVLSSSLAIAFIGTVAAVFGCNLSLDEFREARQMMFLWIIVCAVLIALCCLAEVLIADQRHCLASGGGLSSLLTVSSITSLVMAISVKSRQTKNEMTRSSGNMATVLAWAFATTLLYGRCGVGRVGADFEVQSVLGWPISVLGTIILSSMLFLLEGESKLERSAFKGTREATSQTVVGSCFSFPSLRRSNRWAPVYFASVAVFLTTSVYSILLRGSGFLSLLDGAVAHTHNDLLDALSRDKTDELGWGGDIFIVRNSLLSSSAQLAGSSIWTAPNVFGPLLHLAGLLATLPSLWLLFACTIKAKAVSCTHVSFALLFCLIPVIACYKIPSVQVTGFLALLGGVYQAFYEQRAKKESMMRI
ncbi:hypothetical protein MPSEU_000518100 [Mayamaea pseudoterrestris]|nr:hypothetical protein MPSEU_000518100 [Mayamaea pseudoterrestris]